MSPSIISVKILVSVLRKQKFYYNIIPYKPVRQAIDKNLKGIGDTAIRNYDKRKEIRVQMDIDTAGNINGVKIVHLADFLLRGEL